LQEKEKRERKEGKENKKCNSPKLRSSTSSIQAQKDAEKLLKEVPELRGKKPFKSHKIWRMDHRPS